MSQERVTGSRWSSGLPTFDLDTCIGCSACAATRLRDAHRSRFVRAALI